MPENYTRSCRQLAEELSADGKGLKFTAMGIGRIRSKVCNESDSDEEGRILPTGVLKIMEYLKIELDEREQGNEKEVRCKVIHQKNNNPRIVVCQDMETKKRCLVAVPIKRKNILNKPGKILPCIKIIKDTEEFYSWNGRI